MAAPVGNQNGAKGRAWSEAVRRAIRAKYGVEWEEALQTLAGRLVDEADKGDLTALKEVGDRLDGKPSQALDLGSDPDRPMVHKIVREIVRPKDPNG